MPGVMADSVYFWSGLLTGTLWAVLLWLQLHGQTPCPEHLNRRTGLICLALSGLLTLTLWSPVFGVAGAFFCLGGWSMTLLCLMPVIWAFISLRRSQPS